MTSKQRRLRLTRLLSTALCGVALVAIPIGFDEMPPSAGDKSAFAAGGQGGGHGGGQGGGHGGGQGGGGANSGKGNQASSGSVSTGKTASALGRLNAAHASTTAMANAALNSAVGAIAAYSKAVLEGDIAVAAQSLALAANTTIDASVVAEVNAVLGLDVDEETTEAIADLANDIQASETDQGLGPAEGDSEGDANES